MRSSSSDIGVEVAFNGVQVTYLDVFPEMYVLPHEPVHSPYFGIELVHGRHDESDDDAPVTVEYVALFPGTIEYLPVGQFAQVESPTDSPNLPPGQTRHWASALAPALSRYLPASHFVHALFPGTIEYLPVGQFAQVENPTDSPNLPPGQTRHWASALAPAVSRYLPASHFVQLSAAVPPSADLHEPAEQFWQSDNLVAPPVSRYVPAGQ